MSLITVFHSYPDYFYNKYVCNLVSTLINTFTLFHQGMQHTPLMKLIFYFLSMSVQFTDLTEYQLFLNDFQN